MIIGGQLTIARMQGRADDLVRHIDAYYAVISEIRNPLQVDISFSMTWPVVSEAGLPQLALDRIKDLTAGIGEPYNKLTSMGQAWALAEMGKTDEARAKLAEADEVVTTFKFETYRSIIALVNGMIAEVEGDWETAAEQFRIAVDTAMIDDPLYRVRLGRALRLQGETDEAVKVLESALSAEPGRPRAHLELAQIAFQKGDHPKAREHLNRAQTAWSEAHPAFKPAEEARDLAVLLNNIR